MLWDITDTHTDPHAVRVQLEGTSQLYVPNAPSTPADLADEVKGMYRVLDLISESGTNASGKI